MSRPCRIMAALAASTIALCLLASSARALDVDVRNAPYGATGNGTTNDRAAIQKAITDVNAAGGGTVTLSGPATYLTGDIRVASNVTLRLAAGAVVKQSQTPTDYAHRPARGRVIPGSTVPFITYLDQNYPLIWATNAKHVGVTGTGTIQMTNSGSDENSVLVHAIGFNRVSDYAISDVTIAGASAYNVTMRNTSGGTISGIRTRSPSSLNSDGISLMNSSDLSVHDNDLTTMDDGIYVWASYDDPRRSAWWNSDTPRPSRNIEIYDNTVDDIATNGSHGFLFIDWTAAAPDQSKVEISDIDVHDNTFRATYPVGALTQDIYHPQNEKTPSKDLTFEDNVLEVVPDSTPTGAPSVGLDEMATTGLSADDPAYDFAQASDELYNSNFDAANAFSAELGSSFWTLRGTGRVVTPSSGNRYGEVFGPGRGYSAVDQGVRLTPGLHEFAATTSADRATFRMFVAGPDGSTVASTPVSGTTPTRRSIVFAVPTTGVYRLGIDTTGAGTNPRSGNYARIDDATVRDASTR